MKFSVNWLKQWVKLDLTAAQLAERLTASGLEVDSIDPVAADFDGIVIAEIESCQPHPDADKLSLCTVNDGSAERLQIVCGAPNARPGIRVPLARIGGRIGADFKIKKAKLRGIESHGMLCSARELGLSDDHSGLMELPADTELGINFRDWLALDDHSIEIDLTPNRADCLSIRGLARDVSASCDGEFIEHTVVPVPASTDRRFAIRLEDKAGCPRYVGRVIEHVNAAASTPLWMQEALRRSGVRSISAIVDVSNYVMLELGQPMHAFDLDKLDSAIIVRRGHSGDGEKLVLLDGSEVKVGPGVLAICDANGPVALAGIMGGEASAVSDNTQNILLESAWFNPAVIMGKARDYGMHTDASHRFERGIDPQGQSRAIERASQLILEICGGQAGPVVVEQSPDLLPVTVPVKLRLQRLNKLIGFEFQQQDVELILLRLGMTVKFDVSEQSWTVIAPSARVDVAIEEDLIEEVARIHGYNNIPARMPSGEVQVGSAAKHEVSLTQLRGLLSAAAYQEAINYSFVDIKQLEAVFQSEYALPLANPLSGDLGVLRTSLLPGLLAALNRNLRRQHARVRLFETGLAFLQSESLLEVPRIAAVVCGPALPEQWAADSRRVDYFDIKGDVERLLALRGSDDVSFERLHAPWAHPGASASVLIDEQCIGWCGAVHPQVLKALDIDCEVFAFELDLEPIQQRHVQIARPYSKFPSVRRDIAIWLPEQTTYAEVQACVLDSAGELLQNLVVFDVYHDSKLKKGYKSLAIGLILQNVSSTLTDDVADPVIQQVISNLKSRLSAELRG
jgi:phenylalanyl-tRNA synthetase beta chain